MLFSLYNKNPHTYVYGFSEEPNDLDAQVLGDILAYARAIYLLRKFDITSLHSVAI